MALWHFGPLAYGGSRRFGAVDVRAYLGMTRHRWSAGGVGFGCVSARNAIQFNALAGWSVEDTLPLAGGVTGGHLADWPIGIRIRLGDPRSWGEQDQSPYR